MTTTSYILAWVIYLLSSAGLAIILWKISNHWRSLELKYVSRITFILIAVTPYYSDAEQNRMAPTILISLFELAFGNHETALKAATPLSLLLIISIAFSFIYILTQNKKSTHD